MWKRTKAPQGAPQPTGIQTLAASLPITRHAREATVDYQADLPGDSRCMREPAMTS